MSSAATSGRDKLWMGPGTLEVSLKLFETNRERLIDELRDHPDVTNARCIVLLQGGDEIPQYDTDVNYLFRQESYFMWTFGVIEPGYYGALVVDTGAVHLFAPHYPEEYAVWMGPIHSLQSIGEKYGIDKVHYVEEISSVLKALKPALLLTLKGMNTDSGLVAKEAAFEGIENFRINNKLLFPLMAELRVCKTHYEIEVMKYVIEVSSTAHRKVMRMAKAGKSEYNCESEFLYHCYNIGGCRHVSYTCICASHTNAAILHYGHAAAPNNRFLKSGDLCLFDMGANYFGYAADITCTFPVDGKFTPDQKLIYEAVLKANTAVINVARAGVSWVDLHLLAMKTLMTELRSGGLVKGDIDDMVYSGLGAVFQPHGLGHLLGLDVHDVGGYLDHTPERQTHIRGLKTLRTARVLADGMMLTIEPGCYFIDPLLDDALKSPELSKFLVPEVIERFRNFGGVRIEDDVLITEGRLINFTNVPRTVEEIEDWIAGKDDNKYSAFFFTKNG